MIELSHGIILLNGFEVARVEWSEQASSTERGAVRQLIQGEEPAERTYEDGVDDGMSDAVLKAEKLIYDVKIDGLTDEMKKDIIALFEDI